MPTAGAVYDFLFVDSTLFAGTSPNGDVLMSTDLGQSWVNTGDLSGASIVYSLSQKFNTPYQWYIFAGTAYNGDIFRTTRALGIEDQRPVFFDPDTNLQLLKVYRNFSIFKIKYNIPEDNRVYFKIINISGRLIYKSRLKGKGQVLFPDKDIRGKSGIYFYFLDVNGKREKGKFVIIKN